MENEKFVLLTEKQIDDLVYFSSYRSAKRACDNLFGGIFPYITRLIEDNRKIIEELEYIKLHFLDGKEPKKNSEKFNPQNALSNLTEEQKESLQKAMKAIEINRLVNIPTGANINIPNLNRG